MYSILCIQKIIRGYQARKFYQWWKKMFPIAAKRVQKRYRNYLGAKELEMWSWMVWRILKILRPCVYRFLKKYIKLWRENRNNKAVIIQSVLHMWKYRAIYLRILHKRKQIKCCIQIQCFYRRYLSRCIYLILKEEDRVRRIDVPAAILIQKTFRGKIYGRCIWRQKRTIYENALIIQNFFIYVKYYRQRCRKCVASLKREFSSIIIQKIFRGYVERMKYKLILDKEYYHNIYIPTIIYIQAIVRSFLCRKHFLQMVAEINAAVVIQKYFRKRKRHFFHKTEFQKMVEQQKHESAIKIQALMRRCICRIQYSKRLLLHHAKVLHASKTILHCWQSFKARKHMQLLLDNHRIIFYNKEIQKVQHAIQTILTDDILEIKTDIEHAKAEIVKKGNFIFALLLSLLIVFLNSF